MSKDLVAWRNLFQLLFLNQSLSECDLGFYYCIQSQISDIDILIELSIKVWKFKWINISSKNLLLLGPKKSQMSGILLWIIPRSEIDSNFPMNQSFYSIDDILAEGEVLI